MPRKRTKVEKIREILRLSQELKFSIRQIAEATQVSKTGKSGARKHLSPELYNH